MERSGYDIQSCRLPVRLALFDLQMTDIACLQVGDILMTVNGENVRGKKLSQLRPLIVGPKGTFAALGLKRYTGGPSNLDEYTEYTVELVRGDPIFFLEAENAKGKMKLQVSPLNTCKYLQRVEEFITIHFLSSGYAKDAG